MPTVLVPKTGDRISFRRWCAEFPERGEVIKVNEKLRRVLVETGIKGEGKNIVKDVPFNRICHIFPNPKPVSASIVVAVSRFATITGY